MNRHFMYYSMLDLGDYFGRRQTVGLDRVLARDVIGAEGGQVVRVGNVLADEKPSKRELLDVNPNQLKKQCKV